MRLWILNNWIALLGLAVAILSLVVAALPTYWAWRDRRRKLKVRLRWSQIRIGTLSGREFLELEVINKGCELVLTDVQFEINRRRYQVDHHDDVTLWPVEKHVYTQSAGKLADGIAKTGISGVVSLCAVILEKTGRQWKTNVVPFDVGYWKDDYKEELMEISRSMAQMLGPLSHPRSSLNPSPGHEAKHQK